MENDKSKAITVRISVEDWEHFKLLDPKQDEEWQEQQVAVIMDSLFMDYMSSKEENFPYVTAPHEGGWRIFYYAGSEFRPADGCTRTYPKDRKHNADRKRKAMNRDWWKALRDTEKIMDANGGALIV